MVPAPRVDVVIPVFNGAAYIRQSVRSALEQTGVDVRVIVVDDASTDNTVDALRAMAEPRVTVLTGHPHESTCAARNRGVEASDAPWLCFLDADDLWPKGRTQALLEAITDANTNIAMGYVNTFNGDDIPDLMSPAPSDTNLAVAACVGGTLTSRALFDAVGSFDESLRVGEYVDWLARARATGYSEVVVPTISLWRRGHASNTSRERADAYRHDMMSIVARHRSATRGATIGELLGRKPLTIAYLGHSVTAQRSGYRSRLHALLDAHLSDDETSTAVSPSHRAVNGALGGVGSLVSACLMDYLVIPHAPRLCLVEGNVADAGGATPRDWIGPSVEGIVRQLLAHHIEPVMLLLPTNTAEQHDLLEVRQIYERVCQHYSVAIIDLGLRANDEWVSDGIHTTESGSDYYADFIASRIRRLLSRPKDSFTPLPAPLYMNYLGHASVLSAVPEDSSHATIGRFRLVLPYRELAIGESVTLIDPSGDVLGMLVVADAQSGVVRLEVGGSARCVQIHDEWCHSPRLQGVLWPDLMAEGTQITISMTDQMSGDVGAAGWATTEHHRGETARIIGFLTTSRLPSLSSDR